MSESTTELDLIKRKLPFAAEKESADFQREHIILVIRELDRRRLQHIPAENQQIFQHGRAWNFQRQKREGYDKHQGEMKLHRSNVSVELERIVANDLALVLEFIDNISSSFEQGFMDELVKEMGTAAQEAGNTFQIGKDGLDGETFLNIIRRTQVLVDNEGKVSRPSLYLPPGAGEKVVENLKKLGPEFEERVNALWAEKEKEALENEAQRLARYEF